MRILVDGSALIRAVLDEPESHQWRQFMADPAHSFVVSEMSVMTFRRTAQAAGRQPWAAAQELLWNVETIRLSDQAVDFAGHAANALDPFDAMVIGIAYTDPTIDALASYDPTIAATAALWGVKVLSPGRSERWWLDPGAARQFRVHDVAPVVVDDAVIEPVALAEPIPIQQVPVESDDTNPIPIVAADIPVPMGPPPWAPPVAEPSFAADDTQSISFEATIVDPPSFDVPPVAEPIVPVRRSVRATVQPAPVPTIAVDAEPAVEEPRERVWRGGTPRWDFPGR